MANRRNNRSAQRTERSIKQAFVELSSEKPLAELSVAELCDRADVSRGTFYLHYHDLIDLRSVIADDFIDAFDAEVGRSQPERPDFDGAFTMLAAGCRFMQKEAKTLSLLLGQNGDIAFLRRFEHTIRRHCLAGLEECFPGLGADLFDRYYSFVIAGAVGTIRSWLQDGCKEDPDDLASFMGTVLLGGAQALCDASPAAVPHPRGA